MDKYSNEDACRDDHTNNIQEKIPVCPYNRRIISNNTFEKALCTPDFLYLIPIQGGQ